MSIKPLSASKTKQVIPDFVIQTFNSLIKEKLAGNKAVIYVEDLIPRLITASSTPLTSEEIFSRRLLDVEAIFTQAGWKVSYNQPDRGESYKSHFVFSK